MLPLPDASAFPAQLVATPHWAPYKLILRDGVRTKLPLNPHDRSGAKSNDPTTWGTFAEAHKLAKMFGYGVGFFLAPPYVGVDADHCLDPETGQLTPIATSVFGSLDTYTEVSVSGDGVKAIALGKKPGGRCRRNGLALEIYEERRFFALTGQRLDDAPLAINDCQEAIEHIYGAAFGSERPPSAPRTPGTVVDEDERDVVAWLDEHRPKFGPLWRGDTSAYDSPSSADQALCNILAWRVGGDAARVESIFAQSGLVREKWEQRPDYRTRTIEKAINGVTRFWEPSGSRLAPNVGELSRGNSGDETATEAELRARVAVLERENAEWQRRHASAQRMLANIMQIRRNPHIKAERDTLTACILDIAAEQANGRADAEGWVRQPAQRVADAVGKKSAAARTHRARGEEWGLLQLKIVAEHDPKTGQRRTVTYARTTAPPDEAIDKLVSIAPTREQTWGGKREPCQNCGSENTHRETRIVCDDCGHVSKPITSVVSALVEPMYEVIDQEEVYEVVPEASTEPEEQDDWDPYECNAPGCVRPIVIGQRYCGQHRHLGLNTVSSTGKIHCRDLTPAPPPRVVRPPISTAGGTP